LFEGGFFPQKIFTFFFYRLTDFPSLCDKNGSFAGGKTFSNKHSLNTCLQHTAAGQLVLNVCT